MLKFSSETNMVVTAADRICIVLILNILLCSMFRIEAGTTNGGFFSTSFFISNFEIDVVPSKTYKIREKKTFKINLNHNIKYNLFLGSTGGRFYQKITGVGPNLDESGYETGECGTESRCIQMCEKSADCGAALWKVVAEEGCASGQRKCRHR